MTLSSLSSSELQTVSQNVQTGLTAQLKREMEFFHCPYVLRNEKRTVIVKVACNVFKKTGTFCVVGAVAGGTIGGAIGGAVAGPPGVVAGAFKGAAIGGGIGAAAGFVVSVVEIPKAIACTYQYKVWRSAVIENILHPLFQQQLRDDHIFSDLLCPISREVPHIPVKAPCGHTYDKETIEKWIDSKPPTAKACHVRAKNFSKSELIIHDEHLKKIIERCMQLMEIQKAGLEHEVREINPESDFFQQEIRRIFDRSTALNTSIAKVKFEAMIESALGNPKVSDEAIAKASIELVRCGRLNQLHTRVDAGERKEALSASFSPIALT